MFRLIGRLTVSCVLLIHMVIGCCEGHAPPPDCGKEREEAPVCACGRSHASVPPLGAAVERATADGRRSPLPDNHGSPGRGCTCHASCVTVVVKKVDVLRSCDLLAGIQTAPAASQSLLSDAVARQPMQLAEEASLPLYLRHRALLI